jgi:type VI secretion system protein ImpC
MRRWAALRESPQARSIGLALPRFLLRQPYGKGSDPIEGFSFEEVVAATEHEAFLWGNPAFLCTQVIAQSVVAEAEGMDVAAGLEVDGLPVFRYKSEDGESAMKPCAEAWLVDRAAEYLLRRGFTPVLSIKGRDAVRLPGLVSVSKQGHAPTED